MTVVDKIYSKISPGKLLHVVFKFDEESSSKGRIDIIPADNFIQCSFLNLQNKQTFKPHKHVYKSRSFENMIAQESWVVIKGKVKCILYDIDNTVISTPILSAGDASFTLAGGHTYEILEDNTLVYEYKTGPYEGQELDKVFIDD